MEMTMILLFTLIYQKYFVPCGYVYEFKSDSEQEMVHPALKNMFLISRVRFLNYFQNQSFIENDEQLLYFGHAANDFEALQKFRWCFMVKHFLCMVTGGWRGPESRFFQAFFLRFPGF